MPTVTDRGPNAPGPLEGRRLAEPPSARYGRSAGETPGGGPTGASSALAGPLARASLVAVAGAVALVLVGAILASTFGLLFVAGITGALAGLTLSRAAAPLDETRRPEPRRTLAWLAVALAVGAVAAAAIATWLIARAEGGTLELVDYLLTTFGPFVPAEVVIAAVAAWWGATTGPVQR
jgi:hypothetical protein